MLWFLGIIIYLCLLLFTKEAREKTLSRLTQIHERDERESYITGQASRTAFLSTISLLIFLLFFSVFTVNIYKLPQEQAVSGKTGTLALGLQFNLFENKPSKVETEGSEVIFESRDLPITKTGLLLLLVIWQVGVFKLSARKQQIGAV